jgi:hypothetical protein
MQKIQSLFMRNYDGDRLVRDEVVSGSEWVIAGEGRATRKWDGTCCMIRDGRLFKRHEVKPGGRPPENFEPANDVDKNTGKQQGWLPVGSGPEDRWHREAMDYGLPDGTYELLGPKVQGNIENFDCHVLVMHGLDGFADEPPRTFDELKDWFQSHNYVEGIVWHHPDGRMVKIKAKDFGIKRAKALEVL